MRANVGREKVHRGRRRARTTEAAARWDAEKRRRDVNLLSTRPVHPESEDELLLDPSIRSPPARPFVIPRPSTASSCVKYKDEGFQFDGKSEDSLVLGAVFFRLMSPPSPLRRLSPVFFSSCVKSVLSRRVAATSEPESKVLAGMTEFRLP